METITVKELTEGSSAYDVDELGDDLQIVEVDVQEDKTYVHFLFYGNKHVDVWEAKNGVIEFDEYFDNKLVERYIMDEAGCMKKVED